MSSPIIRANKVSKSYFRETVEIKVLKEVDFKINEGDFVVIKGPSGAGKSTLLNLLGALDVPTDGELLIAGKEVAKMPEQEQAKFRNQFVGFVFQFHHLLAEFSAVENLYLPALIAGKSIDSVRGKAESLLNRMGLGHRINHKPRELSGGEQQRVAIARALMNSPRILLADEPTGNLDSKTSENIFDILKEINREQKQTLIVATHSEQLADMASRIIKIVDGQIENNLADG
jgi:lipoprotein-releasing system ATP-binding protein